MHTFFANFLMIVLLLVSLFLIVLVLIQRGKGGGLAGALGGMGGQSAFGTKAGDLFTRVTIVVATIWMLLSIVLVKYLGLGSDTLSDKLGAAANQPPAASAPEEVGKQPAQDQAGAPAVAEKTAPATDDAAAPAAPAEPAKSETK